MATDDQPVPDMFAKEPFYMAMRPPILHGNEAPSANATSLDDRTFRGKDNRSAMNLAALNYP